MVSLRNLLLAAGLFLTVLAVSATAGTASIPAPTGPVVDLAGVLDDGTERRLAELIGAVRAQTTAEIAVLTVQSTAPETIQEYSIAVFDRWKIGKRGQDNGLLFLVAVRDRKLWITTGYGLEGILPDGRVGEIRDRVIVPYFRAGKYAEGILRGTEALAAVILGKPLAAVFPGNPLPAPPRPVAGWSPQRGNRIALGYFMGFALLCLLVLFIVLPAMSWSPGFRRRHPGASGAAYFLFTAAWAVLGGAGRRGGRSDGWSGGFGGGSSGGGFSSGGFGGFGGGSSGGGGAGGSG
jgi:uncharacterized protein